MPRFVLWLMLMLLGMALAGAVLAQGPGPGQELQAWPLGRMYNPQTVETLKGEIVALEKIAAGRTDIPVRVLLKLKTAKETVTVYLGPEWYLAQQGVKLAAGDTVEVRGSRVSLDNQPVILPNEVKKGDRVMQFWDEQGFPRWRGRGPRAPQR
uniref:DNA-binding protein n=1 Tax=Desulfobacca acetoxidans TaxID=60893 RepID=A0A7C5ET56_9BACT